MSSSSSLYTPKKKSGHQMRYINNYASSHHVHSVASSQYAHYQVHPDISVTAQQKVHHHPKILNEISKSNSSTRNNNNSLRTCSEGFSRIFVKNTIIILSRRRSSSSSGRCTRSAIIRYTSLTNRIHVDIVGSQRSVLREPFSHPSSPEIH